MTRKFLSVEAIDKGQRIVYFQELFKLLPISQMAELADKFTRNEILSSNELRQIIGFLPVDDPRADELRNKNINQSNKELDGQEPVTVNTSEEETN